MSEKKRVRLTIDMDSDLQKKLKSTSALLGKTIRIFVIELICKELKLIEKRKKAKD